MINEVLDVTTTPLGANDEYIGPWKEAPWANHIIFSAQADQAGELFLEGSEDGSTVILRYRLVASADIPVVAVFISATRYVRIRYKNGATAQTRFFASLIAVNHIH